MKKLLVIMLTLGLVCLAGAAIGLRHPGLFSTRSASSRKYRRQLRSLPTPKQVVTATSGSANQHDGADARHQACRMPPTTAAVLRQ